jgi:hypothetical protein
LPSARICRARDCWNVSRERRKIASRPCLDTAYAGTKKVRTDRASAIFVSDNPHDIVYGVVYLVTQEEKLELDVYEGAGIGYERREITVTALHGVSIDVFTYYALEIDHLRQPYHWYKEHVLRGALEHDFPPHYVEHIRTTPSIDDHDPERHHRELSIYLEKL